MNTHNIKVQRLSDNAIMPTKAHDGDAAYDLYCPEDTMVHIGRNLIRTDIAITMPASICAFVRSRSGFSLFGVSGSDGKKHNARMVTGLIDSGYRGNIGVIVESYETFTIAKGTRLAQLQFSYVPFTTLEEVNELDITDRKGGFGSTGIK
ncbi:MAG: hypothetical protein IJV22_04635 [Bacteroidales bacterium]|nr:hypothetical protein [Bacteroidales bacterium]